MVSRQQAIVNRAAELVAQGTRPAQAIELACAAISTTPGARSLARTIWTRLTQQATAAIWTDLVNTATDK